MQENEKLKQNEKIMLAIFEEFLNSDMKPRLANSGERYLEEFIDNCVQKLSKFDSAHVRWHTFIGANDKAVCACKAQKTKRTGKE